MLEDVYIILGVLVSDDEKVIKCVYCKCMFEYYFDKLVFKGLFEQVMEIVKLKVQDI